MNEYEKTKKMFEDFRKMAMEHGVTVIVATQPKRIESFPIQRRRSHPEIIVIDHTNLIK